VLDFLAPRPGVQRMETESESSPSPRQTPWLVLLLLAVFLFSAVNSLVRDSATFDETAHLPAGITYLDRGDFRLNPEHPPLVKIWAALPVWLSGRARPDYRSLPWLGRPVPGLAGVRSNADQWVFGYELLNGPLERRERRDPGSLLLPARLAMLVPALALILIVYSWSRELWGPRGAIVSLILACLSPTLLAHARLVTTDLPLALAYASVLWTAWRFTRKPCWARGALCAICLSGSLLVKFSALLLFPTLALIALAWVVGPCPDREERRRRARWIPRLAVVALLLSFAAIWAGYGFRFAATGPDYAMDWTAVGMQEGAGAVIRDRALEWRVLPEAYVYGLAHLLGGAERRVAFLNGEQSLIGWWYYFPEAFLLKTPPALIAMIGWIAVAACRGRRWRSPKGWFLLLPVALYLGVSISGNLNIGHRHLVPVYPLLFVACGAIGRLAGRPRFAGAALLLLIVGYAASFAIATPRFLSYFNFAAGGSAGGWRYLLDSNIDWGQDLIRLRRWMNRTGIPEIDLAYFGTADPTAYGIRYRKVYMVHDFRPEIPTVRPTTGRQVAVSVNLLQGLYFDRDRVFAEELLRRGWITRGRVHEWLDLRDRLSKGGRRHPTLASWMVKQGYVTEAQRDRIESGLLTAWFERLRDRQEPVAVVGDSIFVYEAP
jgi:hypothetical protein